MFWAWLALGPGQAQSFSGSVFPSDGERLGFDTSTSDFCVALGLGTGCRAPGGTFGT